MADGFVPLSRAISFWPAALGEADFLNEVGLKEYESNINDDAISASGQLVYLRDISFPLLGIPGARIAFLNDNEFTVLDFSVDITPDFRLILPNLTMSLLFESKFLKPVELVGTEWETIMIGPDVKPFEIEIGGVGVDFVLAEKLDVTLIGTPTVSIDTVRLGDSDVIISIQGIVPYLSDRQTPPLGTSAGFRGVTIDEASVIFPAFWNHDASGSSGQIIGRDMIIGTGGFSGTVALELKPLGVGPPAIKACFGNGFCVSLDRFAITLLQNKITGSAIGGTMEIPGFKDDQGNQALINIDVQMGDGDFNITASTEKQIRALRIPNILDFLIDGLSFGREDDRFFVSVSGAIDFLDMGGAIGNFLPDKIDIQELIIWDDGEIELKGGKIVLPKAVSLKIGPVELSVTAVGLGSHEQMHNGNLRKYKYFTFDGGINIDPGGVDASGNGISLYYTVDNDLFGGNRHVFVRIQSIAIDLIIPGSATPESAALLLSGFLAMKDTPNGTEYVGGVDFTLPKLKMGGSAAMRLNPKVPAFLVDVGLELSTPIVLGSTGLGIYGFRALVGQRYVASRTEIGLEPDAPWWQYYKEKVPPESKEGVSVSKFAQEDGFSLGAGVSLATAPDGGRTFSSKLFFLLSLPELFMLQGQAQILKERIGLDTTQDPPFFALLTITNSSVETALGVNYNVPDEGNNIGKIATVNGLLEMGFFFGNSSAWYINIGKDLPEDRRIQVRLLDLFDVYFYLMLSSSGIRTGAGASYELKKKFGPLRAELSAYLDVAARMSFRPKQVGGSIQIGGSVGLYIWKFGFSVSAHASLAAEAPRPFTVTGSLEACVRVLRKDRCAKFSFTWTFDNSLNPDELEIIKRIPNTLIPLPDVGGATNIQTRELFPIWTGSTTPNLSELEDFIVPMDSYIDIEFAKGVNPSALVKNLIGGNTQAVNFTEFFAPQKGKNDRVRHEFYVDNIELLFHNGAAWVPYDFYAAATPMQLAPFVNNANLSGAKLGYWQYIAPKEHNKLRILGTSPISYVSQGSGDIILEESGITVDTIFCGPEPIEKCCINFDNFTFAGQGKDLDGDGIPDIGGNTLPKGQLMFHEKFLMRLVGGNGELVDRPWENFTKAIKLDEGSLLEILFQESYPCVTVTGISFAFGTEVRFYKRKQLELPDPSGMPVYEYELVSTKVFTVGDFGGIIYDDIDCPIDKIEIESGTCKPCGDLDCPDTVNDIGNALTIFLDTLAQRKELATGVLLFEDAFEAYLGIFFNTLLYSYNGSSPGTEYSINQINEEQLTARIFDNEGFVCDLSLMWLEPNGFDFNNIVSITNMRPDPDNLTSGENFYFLVDAVLNIENIVVTLRGKTCWSVFTCSDPCSDQSLVFDERTSPEVPLFEDFLNVLAQNNQLQKPRINLAPGELIKYKDVFFNNPQSGKFQKDKKVVIKSLPNKTGSTQGRDFTIIQIADVNSEKKIVIDEDNPKHLDFRCDFSMKPLRPRKGFAFSKIESFESLRPNPSQMKEGENKAFLVDALLKNKNGFVERVVLSGEAPMNVAKATLIDKSKKELPTKQSSVKAPQPNEDPCGDLTSEAKQLQTLLNTIFETRLIQIPSTKLWPESFNPEFDQVFFNSVLYNKPLVKGLIVMYERRLLTDLSVTFDIFDNDDSGNGYSCSFTLEIVSKTASGILTLTNLHNLRPDPDHIQDGLVYHFLIDAVDQKGNIVTLKGTSCYPIVDCIKDCSTYLYQICVLEFEAAQTNSTIPTQASVDIEVQTIINSFDGSIQPIWRPNTNYAIKITTSDKLYRENSNTSVHAPYVRTSVFAFKTAGPLGHFHIYQDGANTEQVRSDYAELLANNREDEFKLSKLLHYINFEKCFPNADGQLINAKPLFYVDPKLRMFYLKNHVYSMMRDWDDFPASGQNLEGSNIDFEVVIKDPAPDPNGTPLNPVLATWALDPLPWVSQDVTILNNMLTYGDPCTVFNEFGQTMPLSEFQLPELKPLKLYTAIFNNKFKRFSDTDFIVREIHRYPFQTSRYPDFEAQIASYRLYTEDGQSFKDAIYAVDVDVDAAGIANAALVLDQPSDPMSKDDVLRRDFGHPFNRLIEGIFKLQALHPPISTEFNVINNVDNNTILGILVKNPEPFNDPKMPLSEAVTTITMTVNGGSSYKALLSKDYSQAFLTNDDNSMNIPSGASIVVTFDYRLWDGNDYTNIDTQMVAFTLPI